MGLRVSLDGTVLTDTPRGWDEADITTERNDTIRGLFTTYTTDLEFWGDGFDYIDGVLNSDYCQVITVLIESDDCNDGVWSTEFNGIIQLTRISSYNVDERIIKTKILDDTFDAKIDNNKSLKAYVDVGLSKNTVNIEATSSLDISVFDPTAGFNTYEATTRGMYRIYDCFRFIIDYMTDGQVGFKSDVFAGDYYHWMLCNGKELRVGNGNGDQLEVSFKDLFLECHKKTNLSFAIEPSPSGYNELFQVRLEPTEYFEQDDAILTVDQVRGIMMDFNKTELFSDVDIGSKDFDDNVVLSYPPLNFKAFKEENYTILGQCNIDKTLDLVSKYIIDTNIIEDVITNNVDKYDNKVFIIVTDGSKAIKYKEYDEPISQGVDDGGVANRLTDSTADFNADGVVAGDMAVNMLTGLTANINSVDAGGTFCTLDTDIYNNGDGYQIRTQPFNYNDPLTNIRVITRFLGGLPNSVIKHISGQVTADFYAGITTDVTTTSFPTTINPVAYDDDSTPPFFDTGSNYDNVNYYYTVPSSGLYGFEAKAVMRLNGQLGADEIVNGDFSTNSDWLFNYGSISGGSYSISITSVFVPNAFIKQSAFSANTIYKLSFDVTITSGSIIVDGVTYSASGTYTKTIDYSQDSNPPGYLKFTFLAGNDGNAIMSLDNVSLEPTPKFSVTQTIQRISAQGTLLQSFPLTDNYYFAVGEFQREVIFNAQNTFSTFSSERINVIITMTNAKGSNTQIILLENLFNQTTQETDRTGFKTISVDDGGGDILPVDPTTFPIYQYKFDKGITFTDFKALKDAPEKAVLFSKSNTNFIFGWRNQIKWNRKTGKASFDLRAKVKINGDC